MDHTNKSGNDNETSKCLVQSKLAFLSAALIQIRNFIMNRWDDVSKRNVILALALC